MKRLYNAMQRTFYVMLLGLISFSMYGQEESMAPVSGTYAITNVTIIQAPGQSIEMGTVVFKDGIIKSVGKSVSIPPDAIIIKADSMYLYAGFIDGMSHVGVDMPKEDNRRNDVEDPGNPPNDVAGIEPYLEVRTMLKPGDKSVSDWRSVGFTAAHVVPEGRMLPGTGAIILLTGTNSDEMIFKNKTSMFSQLEGARGRIYPSTVIGVMAKYRDLYRNAEYAKTYAQQYGNGTTGMDRPKSDRVLEAFYPVIDKNMPVAFRAESVLDIQRVLTLKRDLGFNLMLGEVKQGWDVTSQIKNANVPVFLSLGLPEMEEEKDDTAKAENKEMTEAEKEQERLDKRKDEMIKKYYQQPALFKGKGIQYGFSTLDAKSNDVRSNLRKIIKQGLSENDALAALTTTPAQLLGLSNVMGTIETGKMANLVLTDKPFFHEESQVKMVFVEGDKYEYESKAKKKGTGEDINPEGLWTYTTETPQGKGNGKIEIEGSAGNYSGTLTSTFSSEPSTLSDIEVSGNNLTFSFVINTADGSISVDASVEVEGDSFKGTLTAGQNGSFPVEGERVPGN